MLIAVILQLPLGRIISVLQVNGLTVLRIRCFTVKKRSPRASTPFANHERWQRNTLYTALEQGGFTTN